MRGEEAAAPLTWRTVRASNRRPIRGNLRVFRRGLPVGGGWGAGRDLGARPAGSAGLPGAPSCSPCSRLPPTTRAGQRKRTALLAFLTRSRAGEPAGGPIAMRGGRGSWEAASCRVGTRWRWRLRRAGDGQRRNGALLLPAVASGGAAARPGGRARQPRVTHDQVTHYWVTRRCGRGGRRGVAAPVSPVPGRRARRPGCAASRPAATGSRSRCSR